MSFELLMKIHQCTIRCTLPLLMPSELILHVNLIYNYHISVHLLPTFFWLSRPALHVLKTMSHNVTHITWNHRPTDEPTGWLTVSTLSFRSMRNRLVCLHGNWGICSWLGCHAEETKHKMLLKKPELLPAPQLYTIVSSQIIIQVKHSSFRPI